MMKKQKKKPKKNKTKKKTEKEICMKKTMKNKNAWYKNVDAVTVKSLRDWESHNKRT